MAVVTPQETTHRSAAASPLDELVALVANDMAAVNAVIVDGMQSSVGLITQLAGYIIAAGGKRLRPILTLATARMCGYQGQDHVKLATAVEFLHTATLLHDDVVDDSDLRRGRASANTVFGNQASVLVGDFLFSRSFLLMVGVGIPEVLRIMSQASAVIAEGEVLQLQTANNISTTEDEYLQVIEGKTAALFSAACRIGAVVALRSPAEQQALNDFGHNLGVGFQLVDDALDYSAQQAQLGKTVGDDFREGKITLPVVLAFQRGDEDERAFWRRTLETPEEQVDGDLERALTLMTKHGTLEATIERARDYGRKALAALAPFPDGPHKQALINIIDFVNDRDY